MPFPSFATEMVFDSIDVHFNRRHGRVALLVVRGVDHDFIKNLEEAGDVGRLFFHDALRCRVEDPHGLRRLLYRTNIRVGPQ